MPVGAAPTGSYNSAFIDGPGLLPIVMFFTAKALFLFAQKWARRLKFADMLL